MPAIVVPDITLLPRASVADLITKNPGPVVSLITAQHSNERRRVRIVTSR